MDGVVFDVGAGVREEVRKSGILGQGFVIPHGFELIVISCNCHIHEVKGVGWIF